MEQVPRKPRRVITVDFIMESFDQLQKLLEERINELRVVAQESKTPVHGGTGVKFIRTLNGKVKKLKADTCKIFTAKKPKRVVSSNCGFLKAHQITPALATFTGWDPSELKSRVDITNHLCKYIKDQNLQDPNKKKNILPDEKLRVLLDYDPNTQGNAPLTYFYLQKLIGKLQVKVPKSE